VVLEPTDTTHVNTKSHHIYIYHVLFIAHLYKDPRRNYLMRLLILLLAIVIGNARARECKYNNPADYDIDNNNVLTFKNECTRIGTGNWNCNGFPSGVTSVVLPEGLQKVGWAAFERCSNLESVTFPEGLQEVGSGAFYWCSSLTSVTLPEGLTQVGSNAFRGCSNLESVTLPEGLQQVGYGAFRDCSSLTSVTFPEGLQYVGEGAFECPILFTPSSNPCTEGNYNSDACKNKIAEEYSQTQFIDLYNRNYTSTCS